MKTYIYDKKTLVILAVIRGKNIDECLIMAELIGYDGENVEWSGCDCGLTKQAGTKYYDTGNAPQNENVNDVQGVNYNADHDDSIGGTAK